MVGCISGRWGVPIDFLPVGVLLLPGGGAGVLLPPRGEGVRCLKGDFLPPLGEGVRIP